jgi:hypothetical protein
MLVRQQLEVQTTTNFLVSQSLYRVLCSSVSNAKVYYNLPNRRPSVFCDECITFLLIAIHGDGSWSTAARQIYIPVVIYEVFHLTMHATVTHAGISTDMTNSIKDVCSRIVLLYGNSIKACWQNNTYIERIYHN